MASRRDFLQHAALGVLATTVIPRSVHAANPHLAPGGDASLAAGSVILFQGDSITDAGRDRGSYYANQAPGMGNGYVHHTVTHLLGANPAKAYRCYNRGISGHKVYQLADRWDDDCLQLAPDVLSLLIGVNDFWHTLDLGYKGTVDTYARDLRALLDRTRAALPKVKVIMGEPFAVAGGSAISARWESFGAYRVAARRIAQETGAVFVPYQDVFDAALTVAPAAYWCPDGVHPSLAGAYLMTQAWLAGFARLGA